MGPGLPPVPVTQTARVETMHIHDVVTATVPPTPSPYPTMAPLPTIEPMTQTAVFLALNPTPSAAVQGEAADGRSKVR